MRTTIDLAGRLVVPKSLRDKVGLVPGPVEVTLDGASVRIESPATAPVERDGHLLLPSTGQVTTVDAIRELRLADQD
ncbi:MAG: AbrB/MazE/SpoVT family DNA-binding domain-containing protein [Bifidobacteriaceae bacterium]|nr:AbrB/MazE/SpoVT family DNA-binding domain-containing protein [Bifidobacteriaceae bacterium]